MYYIYIIKNKINEKVYVGQSTNPKSRWASERSQLNCRNFNNDSNHPLQRAWEKYGYKSFDFEIIATLLSKEDMDDTEIFWIDYYKSINLSYNIGNGGIGPGKFSEETKEKMSRNRKGRIPWNKGKTGVYSKERLEQISKDSKKNWGSGEFVQNQKNMHIGQVAWNKGIPCAEETKEKLRQANIGRKFSEERNSKISKSLIGNKRSLGYKHTEETIRKRIEARKVNINKKGIPK